jgi:prepilin-type N-terminal cleavage/methylation domain-containing protein
MKTNKGYTLVEVMVALVIISVLVFAIGGPVFGSDPEGATRVLQANNYKDIKITGYKWFNGTKEYYNTGFEATAPNGTRVSGNVSRGILFKGSTIRLD